MHDRLICAVANVPLAGSALNPLTSRMETSICAPTN